MIEKEEADCRSPAVASNVSRATRTRDHSREWGRARLDASSLRARDALTRKVPCTFRAWLPHFNTVPGLSQPQPSPSPLPLSLIRTRTIDSPIPSVHYHRINHLN